MKSTSKKPIVLALAALAMTITACGVEDPYANKESQGGGNVNASVETNKEADISVDPNIDTELSILVPSGNQYETDIINSAFNDGFAIQYPNVKLKINYVSISSYESSVRNMSMAGNLPDIVWTNNPEYIFLVKNDIVEPLDSYFNAGIKAGGFSWEDVKKDYFDMGAYQNVHYVVPRSADCVVTFYNKKILTDSGIDMSKIKNGWTWDDFLSVCADWRTYLSSVGKGNDYYCCDAYLNGWNSVVYPMLRSFGGEVLDESGKLVIDSAGSRECVEAIHTLVNNNYVVKAGTTAGTSFETGDTPFCFQSASFSHYDEKAAIHGDIDIVTFPLITKHNTPKIGAGIAGYSMSKKARNKALAYKFLEYLVSEEGQNLLAKGGLNTPPIRKSLNDYKTAEWGKGYEDKNLQAYLDYDEDKISDDFLLRADPSHFSRMNLAFQDFIDDAAGAKKSTDKVISDAVSNFKDALGL